MKRNKKERLLILQNILLSESHDDAIMGEDEILDAMDEYVERLSKEEQRLYTLYYINMINHRNIGIRYGVSGGSISYQLRVIGQKLKEMIHGKK